MCLSATQHSPRFDEKYLEQVEEVSPGFSMLTEALETFYMEISNENTSTLLTPLENIGSTKAETHKVCDEAHDAVNNTYILRRCKLRLSM